ncbi:MBL fold metallo-hydrolase [candidate division KSB1 bacterium]|nr:MBL fold metallo-hydrolase [candidate division KSB1 bacterium]
MILERLEVGPLVTNCYIIGCEETKEGAVVDPGGDEERILARVEALGINIKYIVNTHGHSDHITGNRKVKEATGARLLIHPKDAGMLTSSIKNFSVFFGHPLRSPRADGHLKEGDIFTVGSLLFKVFNTPGHSKGSICLYHDNLVLVGDTLFWRSIGRTDFPGGSYKTLIVSIKEKLLILPDQTRVLPGHGPETVIGEEKLFNTFL